MGDERTDLLLSHSLGLRFCRSDDDLLPASLSCCFDSLANAAASRSHFAAARSACSISFVRRARSVFPTATRRPRCYDVGWLLRVKPSLGRHRREDITSPMIESAMVTWPGGASAKNDALAVPSRLLDAARRSRFIDYNPVREVRRPSMRESVSPISRALTLEQVATLLALVPEGVYRRYLATLVYTGVRAGEATALRVRDVDFAHNIIRVSRSKSPGRNGELVEQSPKSHKSREVPLIAAMRPYVKDAARGKKPDELLLGEKRGVRPEKA